MKHVQVTAKGRVYLLIMVITILLWTFIGTLIFERNFSHALEHTIQVAAWGILIPALAFTIINLWLKCFD